MLANTNGIVLQTIKHSDSGIVAHILTQEYGLISFMVKGIYSKKRGHLSAYFQPLQVLNLEIYYKKSRSLQSVKEVSLVTQLSKIPYDFSRNSMAFFVGEVLRKTMNEEEPNRLIYDFAFESVLFLDRAANINNFHIGFIVGLTKYLGIAPATRFDSSNHYFDMQNGVFTNSPPLHGYYMDPQFSELLSRFSTCSIEECHNIPLTGNQRSSFLDSLLSYYTMHLPGLKKIKSLEVLSELFRQ